MAKEINMKNSEAELKALAKAIGASLSRSGHKVPHMAMLDAVASSLNKRNWQTLKASTGAKATAESAPATETALIRFSSYDSKTKFWVKLANLSGYPLKELPSSAESAMAFARECLGEKKSGVLSWGGWNLPADLDFATSTVDAGDFKPASGGVGSLTVRYPKGELHMEVAYTATSGWYLTGTGAADVYRQVDALVPDDTVVAAASPVPLVSLPGPEVRAKFWTDDHVIEAVFDAQAYLMQASDKALLGIMQVGYCGDYWTDNVAEYFADKALNDDIVEGFNYLRAIQKTRREPLGFECEVDGEAFLRWMHKHKPGLLAVELCTDAQVELLEAQEDEVQGMWDWRDTRGNASGHAFSTKEEAALNAMRNLGLLDEALEFVPGASF